MKEKERVKEEKERILGLVGASLERLLPEKSLIIFFGSLIEGGFGRTSDIDVAIFSSEKLSAKILAEIEKALEGLPLLRTIEVVDLKRIKNPEFIEKIIAEGYIWKSSEGALSALREHLENLKKS
ncbi:hypothetical protein THC_1048 [Caldimicrobium thiodismutans]|uniref:Polymerase beta nucleotidyltransferase domain-containing protein n=1 Tax=Caldimicrobium thiodismutans TaxID=1653476 RepID=A0A0U4N2D5_9BACT|nr:nucleotidyltransferase domain-containing protein [Caldimicrobium thiodismutans]BAU23430.1 hypothetical protein THC_1048 [Caldimicrobium thiodismutans]